MPSLACLGGPRGAGRHRHHHLHHLHRYGRNTERTTLDDRLRQDGDPGRSIRYLGWLWTLRHHLLHRFW